uniref:NADH-ubiquinone oxidoreductase chain 3 n=1 Tax=Paroligoneurus sp. QL-2014 TaxID=1491722 RepID=A0A0U1WEL1_9HYME|nr:NADH dehydrogenase subunit 3 [Paroligoneurus sp. QL-2014]
MLLLLFILFLILLIGGLLYLINLFIMMKFYKDYEKMSSFECGFDSFEVSRLPFSIHFYLIGVLFLIFDVEIVLMFPLVSSLNLLNYYFWLFISFFILLILYFGLEFEKKEGGLKWMI